MCLESTRTVSDFLPNRGPEWASQRFPDAVVKLEKYHKLQSCSKQFWNNSLGALYLHDTMVLHSKLAKEVVQGSLHLLSCDNAIVVDATQSTLGPYVMGIAEHKNIFYICTANRFNV